MFKKILLGAFVAIAVSGCSGTPPAEKYQQAALDTASARARFEMNCPDAQATVLSTKEIEPISFRFGVARMEYTIGIRGCGREMTLVTICAEDGSGCVAGNQAE
jgi:outer membrane lipoprotein-sorting protein